MSTEEYSVGYAAGHQDGWNAAIDSIQQRQRPALWTEAQHERAYRNSPKLHKDVKSLAAFKRVAKEIAAMYGIKENP